MRCKECDRKYHHCIKCDSGGIPWAADGYCSGDCYYEWSQAEIERLRQLCLASEHLLRGAESIYDPRGDTGPTHWLQTRDKLLRELEAARAAGGE